MSDGDTGCEGEAGVAPVKASSLRDFFPFKGVPLQPDFREIREHAVGDALNDAQVRHDRSRSGSSVPPFTGECLLVGEIHAISSFGRTTRR